MTRLAAPSLSWFVEVPGHVVEGAACAEAVASGEALPDDWFPGWEAAAGSRALLICAGCPVIEDCHGFIRSMPRRDRAGIWGGTWWGPGRPLGVLEVADRIRQSGAVYGVHPNVVRAAWAYLIRRGLL